MSEKNEKNIIMIIGLCLLIIIGVCVYLFKGEASDMTNHLSRKSANGFYVETQQSFLINYGIENKETITKYQHLVSQENEISFYVETLKAITGQKEIRDYAEYKQIDKYTITPCGTNVKEITCYQLVYYTQGNTVLPGLLCVGTENRLYSLSDSEYEILKKTMEKDDAISSITYKIKEDSYYDIEGDFPKNDIIIISSSENYSDEYQCYGSFIDQAGYFYQFELSDHDFNQESEKVRNTYGIDYKYNDSFYDSVYYDIYYKTNPVGRVDLSDLMKITNNILFKIDYSSEWVTQEAARDAGSGSIVVYPKFIRRGLEGSGDWESFLDDPTAKKTCKLIWELLKDRNIF